MLDRGDASLVQRDPHMPGLGVLLDTERFGELLHELRPGFEIGPARARYIRYKPGTSCIAAYRVRVDGKKVEMYARCHAMDGSVKVDAFLERRPRPGPLGDGVMIALDRGIAIHVFPNDRHIRAMRLFECEPSRRRMSRILPAHRDLWRGSLKLLRYKPERRAVARIVRGGPKATLRMYPHATFAAARERAWAFTSEGSLWIPPVIGDSGRYCTIANEWFEGRSLLDVIGDPALAPDELGRVGEALAQMHRQRPALQSMYTAGDLCAVIEGSADMVAALVPGLGERVRSLCGRLGEALGEYPWRSHAVHGDFTPDQVLLSDDKVAILDFDRAGYGDPLLDLGSFAASLLVRQGEGELASDRVEECMRHLVRGLCGQAGPDERDLRLFTTCALVRLLPEPFRYRAKNWPEEIEALLCNAERMWAAEAVDV